MAIRNIRKYGDEILRKKARDVTVFDDNLKTLLEDMAETMKDANGVGLAAPQVGILKKVVVIDVGNGLIELINPEIVFEEGEVVEVEGCLSIPGVNGEVARPQKVKVKALDRNGKKIEIEGEDLLARALCHEIDHLNGILFVDKVIKFVKPDSEG
ncbi:peptide deformylase [Biomaibacter acetigenes]|uniref:Peptide deformylase n=1 Tax=Biomaibacter acetigenes TaxID=2316383 RepID=A0A3G2R4S2_9FIRM|nr:peptide deformylase [Biomaibacter acetigenes]AYO30402.1 peptide deformylase [Biomaibacter acetigenes]MDN5312338.1 peptide deformylase [Thermoanaerobacteraceae bacterium]RKL63159.1 peptide deformylase [Thermoanaerobacteraceae bacterium SP2]